MSARDGTFTEVRMKLICTHKCFFHGRSTSPGETVEVTKAEAKSDIVKSSFKTPESDKPAGPAKISKDELTDDDMKQRLSDWGVMVPVSIKRPELLKLYDSQTKIHTSVK
jgi:hypothetical protein